MPFLIGSIGPKSKKEIQIIFRTEEAKVVIATIIVKVTDNSGKEVTRVVKVSAIGKYPFIILDSQNVDFGNLLVGKTKSKEFVLQNDSLVPTQYVIEKVSDDGHDKAIQVDHTSGTLPPGHRAKVTVTYTPQV